MSQLMKRVAKKGFTLIELMIVVAIIGILAAIAIPKFADLITKSKESAAKGSLGSIRSAVSIYYSDNEGIFPATTSLREALTLGSRYLDVMPKITIPRPGDHASSEAIQDDGAVPTDVGGWYYSGSARGVLAINCTHLDTKNSTWSVW